MNLGDILDNTSSYRSGPPENQGGLHCSNVSVTIVLIGRCTWQSEIRGLGDSDASLRDTRTYPRCGLLGILLPQHPEFQEQQFDPRLRPPRLADDCWESRFIGSLSVRGTGDADRVRGRIHEAFLKAKKDA